MCQAPRIIRMVILQVKKWRLEQVRDSPKVKGKTEAELPLSSPHSATALRHPAHGDIYYFLHHPPPSPEAGEVSPDAVSGYFIAQVFTGCLLYARFCASKRVLADMDAQSTSQPRSTQSMERQT